MADYTYQELMRMQNDAIRRAEDMQKRARRTVGIEEGEGKKKEREYTPAQEPRRIKMPEGYLNTEHKASQGECNSVGSGVGEGFWADSIKSPFGEISIDSDKALLLSLIMLLSEEQADELLIMALLYMLT